ncbi:UNVERIFIED_CONTAM: Trans-cinnamate 4-monooxygenase [Sesamum radiatum]|uniref:Trans-cinnamate 4-monooxygenase n=1 Tax=Sesamum radiatum TaxID=300843 RepID=A0AAW2UNH7_SESRA
MDLLLLLLKTLVGLLSAAAAAILISKLRGKRLNLPPGPFTLPLVGSWLQIGNNLDHHDFINYAKKFGQLFLLRMGQRNIAVVSSTDLAREVLLARGKEFGSRSRNIVFDIFTGKGQDMVFAEYGDHWRKMRRIVSVPFFTNRVVQQYRREWEAEVAKVVEEVRRNPAAAEEGVVLRRRLELMVYNNVYKMMFDKRFESEEDPLFVKLKRVNGERSKLGQSREYNFGDFVPILRPFLRGYLKTCREVTRRRLNLYKDSFIHNRKSVVASRKGMVEKNNDLKCGIDHFLEAQKNGEINEDNVLLLIENMNVAGRDQGNPSPENDCSLFGPPYEPPPSQARGLRHPCRVNDPTHWKKPEEFRPERFLEEESNVEAHGNNIKYIPFGVGRRNCPGMLNAMAVLGITLGSLVQNFELLPPPGQSKIDTAENNGQFATRMLNHATIVLKPRYV